MDWSSLPLMCSFELKYSEHLRIHQPNWRNIKAYERNGWDWKEDRKKPWVAGWRGGRPSSLLMDASENCSIMSIFIAPPSLCDSYTGWTLCWSSPHPSLSCSLLDGGVTSSSRVCVWSSERVVYLTSDTFLAAADMFVDIDDEDEVLRKKWFKCLCVIVRKCSCVATINHLCIIMFPRIDPLKLSNKLFVSLPVTHSCIICLTRSARSWPRR